MLDVSKEYSPWYKAMGMPTERIVYTIGICCMPMVYTYML